MKYYEKYIKYKNKYIYLKNKLYGGNQEDLKNLIDMINYVPEHDVQTINDFINEKKINIFEDYIKKELYRGKEFEQKIKPIIVVLNKYRQSYEDREYEIEQYEYYQKLIVMLSKYSDMNIKENKQILLDYINKLDGDTETELIDELKNIFNIEILSIESCEDIDIHKIIITKQMINGMINRGRFIDKSFDEINKLLIDEGFIINNNAETIELKRMDRMMDETFDYTKKPIDLKPIDLLESDNDIYDILNGRHRVTRAIIENKQTICANFP